MAVVPTAPVSLNVRTVSTQEPSNALDITDLSDTEIEGRNFDLSCDIRFKLRPWPTAVRSRSMLAQPPHLRFTELDGERAGFPLALASQLEGTYRVSRRNSSVDFESFDGQRVIEARSALHGSRDLDAAIVSLARVLQAQPDLKRAILVARTPRMAAARLRTEWKRTIDVLDDRIAKRLCLVALAAADHPVVLPREDDELTDLMRLASQAAAVDRGEDRNDRAQAPWSAKTFAVWEILLDAWLRREGPLSMQELAKRSRASHASVTATLHRLHQRGEIQRSSSRGAEFASTPRRSLNEMVVLADSFRVSVGFVDASGRRPDPMDLLRRIRKRAPEGAAIGGVEAARFYVPNFDLNGLPRLDVSVAGSPSLKWVREIDPALRPARQGESSSILVVHRIRTPPRFDKAADSGVPFAGPAETLLDLYDLRLTSQADEFIQSMRRAERRG